MNSSLNDAKPRVSQENEDTDMGSDHTDGRQREADGSDSDHDESQHEQHSGLNEAESAVPAASDARYSTATPITFKCQ